MKRTLLLLTLITSLILPSCNSRKENSAYDAVQPGLTLYNRATFTNNLAMDGVSAAIRLGIILADMKANNLPVVDGEKNNWDKLPTFTLAFNNKQYRPKDFLFGSRTDIIKNGDIFNIEYSVDGIYFSNAVLDNFSRKGVFTIDTKGVNLTQSTAENPWMVTIGQSRNEQGELRDKTMGYTQNEQHYASVECSKLSTKVWYSDNSVFTFESTDYTAYYTATDITQSNWTSSGTLKIDNFQGLSYSTIIGAKYENTIDTTTGGKILSGEVINYATGGLREAITPLLYTPATALFAIVNGVEEVELVSGGESLSLPNNYVKITWSEGSGAVSYNGTNYEF